MFATCLCHVLFHVPAVGKLGKCQVYGLVLCFMPCFYFMFDHVFVNKLHFSTSLPPVDILYIKYVVVQLRGFSSARSH